MVNIHQKNPTLMKVLHYVACIPVELKALPFVICTRNVLIFLSSLVQTLFFLFIFASTVHGVF